MKAAGIENVLALRGDAVPGATPKDFKFAKDLIPVAREAGFCVGAGRIRKDISIASISTRAFAI